MSDAPTRTVPPDGTANETHHFDGAAAVIALPASPAERYELHTPIARGGMGEVFAARDLALNREVAVKVLRADLRDHPAITARFVEEARITGQLQHPAIPPVHDLGSLPDGRPFIAMKLIKGRTLADLLAHSRADTPALVGIFEQVCQAVAFAHERSVIHRDLKPGNVMVGKFNEVQVMDWGLAKVMASGVCEPTERADHQEANAPRSPATVVSVIQTDRDGSSLTQAGSLLGTPAYMPPEQAKGDVDRTDARSDVFALGAMLCELLTGAPPYSAPSSAEVQALALTAQIGPAFVRLDASGADVELIALAKQCLAPKPDDRPTHAGELARAVAEHRASVAEKLRASELARARAEERRKRVQVALAAAVALLLAVGGAFAWWQEANKRKAERERAEARQTAEREREDARTREAVTAALNEADAALRADDMPRADTALARAKERLGDDGPADLRERLVDLTRDREIVEALERLADGRADRELTPTISIRDRYADVFQRYGLDLTAGNPTAMAARVNGSPVRTHLLAGLDDTFQLGSYGFSEMPACLPALLKLVDGEPVRTEIREAMASGDQERVLRLVRTLEPASMTPGFAAMIGSWYLPEEESRRILTAALQRYPSDFRLHNSMVTLLTEFRDTTPEAAAVAIIHARVLVALRPTSPRAYSSLASALEAGKQYDEAISVLRKGRDLESNSSLQWTRMMGRLIELQSGEEAKLLFFRAELARTPDDPEAHYTVGSALMLRDPDAALACFRRAIELKPTTPLVAAKYYHGVAYVLEQKGDLEGALVAHRQAVDRSVGSSWFFSVRAGRLIRRQGKYRESLQSLEQTIAQWPKSAQSSYTTLRFEAACSATVAGTIGGTNPYPREEWPALRRKALTWLREDLAGWRREVAFDRRNRSIAHLRINRWLTDTNFARVRHPLYLAALPPDEAKEWLALWNEVRKFREEIAIPLAPPPREVMP